MMARATQFTVTSLVAVASQVLEDAGYRAVPSSATEIWAASRAMVFEDAHGIVCVAAYETWAQLSSRWTQDQATLVTIISRHLIRTDAKAWDGYLVLLTPSFIPASQRPVSVKIQRNTLHVRKLLSGGDELNSVSDVRRTLLPLLPLDEHYALKPRDLLDSLPPLLTQYGIDEESAQTTIAAFGSQRPVIEELHTLTLKKRELQP